MRLIASVFVLVPLLATGLVLGCAALGEGNGTGGAGGAGPTLGCTNSVNDNNTIVDWELRVSPEPIESGQPFIATLDGVAVFDEGYLDNAHVVLPEGLREVNLVDLNATVHVRSGAIGDDVTLIPDPALYEYECDFDRSPCNHANDVLDDPPDPPGLRGNTDCEPVSKTNPCGRFLLAPTNIDCAPDGVCERRGKKGQCDLHGFCITGGVRIELQEAKGQYTADVHGKVLFGWDDEKTGATIEEEEPDKGTWILPPAVYDEPTGRNGIRVTVVGFGAAAECTMGVDSQGPLGVDSISSLSSRTPDSALISFPIQAEAF